MQSTYTYDSVGTIFQDDGGRSWLYRVIKLMQQKYPNNVFISDSDGLRVRSDLSTLLVDARREGLSANKAILEVIPKALKNVVDDIRIERAQPKMELEQVESMQRARANQSIEPLVVGIALLLLLVLLGVLVLLIQ